MATTPEWLLKLLRGINTKDISVPENYEANRTDPTTYSAVEPSLVDAGLDAPDPGEIMPPEGESLPELPRTGIFNTNALPTDVDEQDALDAMVLADRVRSLESSKEKVAGFTKPEEQTPEEKSYGAKAAGVVAGIGPAGAVLANPALAYPAYVAGKSAIDIKDAVQNPDSALARGLKNELKGIDNMTRFPETASAAGEIVGGNVVPEAGVNLLGTLTKALTGGIKGLSGGAQKVLSTTDAALNDTRSALAPIADSKVARLLGLMAGASDKAAPSALISQLAFGEDITGFTNKNASGNLMQIFDKPFSSMTPEEHKFVQDNWDTYLKYKAEQGGTGLTKEKIGYMNDLRKGYATENKDFPQLKGQYDRMVSLDNGQENGLKDLTYIYILNKTLDPGSRVTEGEVQTAGNSGNLSENAQRYFDMWFGSGGKLSTESRANLKDAVTKMYGSAVKQLERSTKQYSELAQVQGVDPKYVIIDFGVGEVPKTNAVGEQKLPANTDIAEEKFGIPQATGVTKTPKPEAKVETLKGKTPRNPDKMAKAVKDANDPKNPNRASAKKYVLNEGNYGK